MSKGVESFEANASVWVPYSLHGDGGEQRRVEPKDGDRYATVDDLADGVVVFEVSSWPGLDVEGRLHWTDAPSEDFQPLAVAQARINASRLARGVTAAERPLRVGDAFLVRGGGGPGDASDFIDISAAARDAAKAAMHGAAASTVSQEYVERMRLDEDLVEPTGRGAFGMQQRAARREGRGDGPNEAGPELLA